jgi:hypothetical protein
MRDVYLPWKRSRKKDKPDRIRIPTFLTSDPSRSRHPELKFSKRGDKRLSFGMSDDPWLESLREGGIGFTVLHECSAEETTKMIREMMERRGGDGTRGESVEKG